MDIEPYILRAGDVDTAADFYAALVALQAAIGLGSINAGLRDSDIVGPVPNVAFDKMVSLQPLQWRSYMETGKAGGFPITSHFSPITGLLAYVAYQADLPHVLVIGKNGKVVYGISLAATSIQLLAGPIGSSFKRGKDIITVANYPAGTDVPAVGDPLDNESWAVPADYALWFIPEDE